MFVMKRMRNRKMTMGERERVAQSGILQETSDADAREIVQRSSVLVAKA